MILYLWIMLLDEMLNMFWTLLAILKHLPDSCLSCFQNMPHKDTIGLLYLWYCNNHVNALMGFCSSYTPRLNAYTSNDDKNCASFLLASRQRSQVCSNCWAVKMLRLRVYSLSYFPELQFLWIALREVQMAFLMQSRLTSPAAWCF